MIKNRLLKTENAIMREALLYKIVSLNEIIKPGFNFGSVTKKDNLKEYFAGLILSKIYSLVVSMNNSIFANDVFISIYLYRYIYELSIKVFYIFSGSPEDQILSRLNEFFDNKKWNLAEIKDAIDINLSSPELFRNHKKSYESICKFVHPNIDSLNLHLNRTDDQQFEFICPNINLTIWYIVEIMRLFMNFKILNLNTNIDQKKLRFLQSFEVHP
ncbi:MAG: hypothetical protein WCW25_01990 [Patescibacteria group bacterium]|jgi:hypothetical protein